MVEGVPVRASGDTLRVRLVRRHADAVVERRRLDSRRTATAVLVGVGALAAIAGILVRITARALGPNY